jgi:hypothetical protein
MSHPLVTVAGVSQICMGLWEILTIKLRGLKPGQVLITKRPTGESGAKVASSCNCGRRKPKFWGQDGQVVKAGALGDTHD